MSGRAARSWHDICAALARVDHGQGGTGGQQCQLAAVVCGACDPPAHFGGLGGLQAASGKVQRGRGEERGKWVRADDQVRGTPRSGPRGSKVYRAVSKFFMAR